MPPRQKEVTMPSTKCVACSKVKGKRLCQIHAGAFICPRCCAQIRNADCAGCSYYTQAEDYARTKTPPSRRHHFILRIDPAVDEEVDHALAMLERGNRMAGESTIATLLRQHPDLHTVQFAMGVVRARQKRLDEALEHFENALDIFPHFVEAWFNKGAIYQAQLDVGGMIRAFQKVLELGHPADECVQQAKRIVGSLAQQIRDDSGISLDEYVQAHDLFDTAVAMMEQRCWPQALEGFQAVIALNPTHTQSYGNMGICYAYLGRKQEALTAFERALALDPHYEPALVNRRVVAALSEGETLPESGFGSVAYYRDAWLRSAEQRR